MLQDRGWVRSSASAAVAVFVSLTVVVTVVLGGGPALGAPDESAKARCDRRLKPAPGAIGYTWRGNRCEGFYESPISAPALSVVSVLIGKIAYSLKDDSPLELEAPKCHDGSIQVRALSLRPRTYYRMDAELSPGERLDWPVNDILRRAKLRPSVLGAYGFEKKNKRTTYLPLRIFQAAKKKAKPASKVSVAVRTGTSLETVKWRIVDKKKLKKNWHTATKRPVPGQAIVRFDVPLQTKEGVTVIEMAAKERATDTWSTLRVPLLMCP